MEAIELVRPNLGMWFWTTALFIAVLVILSKTAWGPILKGLEEREKSIADDLKRAETARIDSEKMVADLKAQQTAELASQNERLAAMLKNAEHRREELLNEAKADAAKLREQALADIEREREKAISAIRGEVVTLTLAAAQQVIGREIKPEDHLRLIEQSLPSKN